jgi:hypothetical protein
MLRDRSIVHDPTPAATCPPRTQLSNYQPSQQALKWPARMTPA